MTSFPELKSSILLYVKNKWWEKLENYDKVTKKVEKKHNSTFESNKVYEI